MDNDPLSVIIYFYGDTNSWRWAILNNHRLGMDTLLIGALSGITAKLIQDLLGAIIIMFFCLRTLIV